ncbi:fused phosphoenolpyruvate-protein phosphotransferase PtsP/GAF domain protein [Streptomyces sp. YIM 121038]|uniref:helix-turn-helix domain-containing protein n=1 Tax=Streptomyces sp. YIM 121038 TaxID=2136401 RepID=UPI001110EDF0|nr:GAF domain-containing protein [Streptomyces sp. YIM 121038]QCX80394.1 fused phosphoenolpyruvate-protein phosphotransferase PtsP/GAF domain protein [Streptomyces sp. YIM 121038]
MASAHARPGTRTAPAPDGTAAAALRELIGLLGRHAPAEQFARPAAAARAAGADRAQLALIEEAADAALAVRRTLDQHRRREAELSALFDTAGDLAALTDLDAVLRAIVRRARLLLRTDVAYLTLNDTAAGDTFMRVTDGCASATFQQLRLGMGEGLGGLVAQTARPYASADYRVDTRFQHTRAIDTGVGEEGLRGILGVPLRVGSRVIGVLYAADRSPRDFTPDQIALLASLADHAAVAIDGARLLEETRAALVELNAATATAHAQSQALRRAAETHDRLTDIVLRGGDVADVAEEIAALLDGGLVVQDADGTELARVGAAAPAAPARGVAASRSGGRAVHVDGVWVSAVLAGPELLGSIALGGRPDLTDSDRRLFERASLDTALLLLLRRTVAEAEDRVRGELLDDLLTAAHTSDPRRAERLALRARRLGVDLTEPTAVLVLHGEPDLRARLAARAIRHARTLRGLAGPQGGHVVLLAPTAAPGPLAERLAAELGEALGAPVTVGAAGPATGPARLPAAHAEAQRCLRALTALGRAGEGASLPDLGFVGVLLGDRTDVAGYVERVLGPVLAYDARRGTDLVRTLEAYFDQGASPARAKDVLHVHVNTVVQRLERTARLLGADWNTPARALELQLALRLNRLSR